MCSIQLALSFCWPSFSSQNYFSRNRPSFFPPSIRTFSRSQKILFWLSQFTVLTKCLFTQEISQNLVSLSAPGGSASPVDNHHPSLGFCHWKMTTKSLAKFIHDFRLKVLAHVMHVMTMGGKARLATNVNLRYAGSAGISTHRRFHLLVELWCHICWS